MAVMTVKMFSYLEENFFQNDTCPKDWK